MRVAIGADHRGFRLKQEIAGLLAESGYDYKDFGSFSEQPVDYPDVAREVAQAVAKGEFDRGILICSTGIGVCIAANKVKGIRAALCCDSFCAARARQHNDANILCLAAEQKKETLAEMVRAFLTEKFEGGRHQRRIDKIKAMEG
jgi:ribose 5-phosphate isomerase B